MRPHTSVSAPYHIVSRKYLAVLVVVLSSTGKCDPPPDDHRLTTQTGVTTQTTIYPSFWSDVNRKSSQNTQITAESTHESLTSSLSVYNTVETLNTPSTPLKISTDDDDSGSQEYPMTKVTAIVDDRITTSDAETTISGGNYDFSLQTTFSSAPETVANACDTDQLEVTTNPGHINASTHETHCSLLVNAPNSTAISVSVLDSDVNNTSTYFYIELLESQILNNSKRINLISLDNTPCVMTLQGNQFRFHFQNTKMKVRICNKEVVKSVCYETVHPLIEATQCSITSYESKIQSSPSKQLFKYGFWQNQRMTVVVTQFKVKCTCRCLDSCICTLGYRQWLPACTDTSQDNTTTSNLVVYAPTIAGLSFDNTGLHAIQHDAFLGLEGVLVLILSYNRLSMLPPTVCQNLPKLKVLKLDNNQLVNLTSDSFMGRCEQQLLMLYLQSNYLTHLPHDLFKSNSKLSYLNLKKNRLTLPVGVFDALGDLQTLDLSRNNIFILLANVFHSLDRLHVLDLSSNDIFTLPVDVFHALGDLRTLNLSGNNIHILPGNVFHSLGMLFSFYLSNNNILTLPVGVFDAPGHLQTLDLSGNDISTLPGSVFHSTGGLYILDLSDNGISTLPAGVFHSLGWLFNLDLSDNDISTLLVDLFYSLDKLNILNLSNNKISSLPDGVFDSLHRLIDLNLGSNGISTLPAGVFYSMDWLYILDLSANNISTLPVGVFQSFNKLYILDLSANGMSTLPVGVFNSLGHLTTLNLSGNDISTLPVGVFDLLGRLHTLDLSDNKILLLPDDLFKPGTASRLRNLNLRSNNISTMHAHVFDHLSGLLTLDISHNSLSQTLSVGVFSMLDKLISLNLCCNNLKINAPQTFASLTGLKVLDISKNNIEQFSPHIFETTSKLISLEISENNLRTVPEILLTNLSRLIYLNMSKNSLSRLPSFSAQGQLQVLDVSENQLTTLKPVTFENLKSLTFLSLAKNSITTLYSHVFFNLGNIEFINASYNAIQKINSNLVSNESKLQTLDLRGNKMYKIAPHSFTSLTISTIIVDKYATCCFLNEEKCISMKPRTEYLTCNRMLRDVVLRISVWVLGLSAFICNVIAFCIRLRKQQTRNKVQALLISNLALSDLLMGVNMLILAIADVYYGQYFPSYADIWRQSFSCKLAGFLSIFSSEGSVFFITLISIDRMLGMKYPFGGHRLEIKSARICVTLAWLMALLISVIPISLTNEKGNFYSISEVCIGIPIVRTHLTTFMNKSTEVKTTTISGSPVFQYFWFWHHKYNYVTVKDYSIIHVNSTQNVTYTIAENAGSAVGSIYSIVIFISVNFFCFLLVACCYAYIYFKARKTTKRTTESHNRSEELRAARKMFVIVFTDFCCWVPLSFLCILTQSGVIEVSPEMYAWTVGFILPINSSINPFLYVLYETISDRLKQKEKRKDGFHQFGEETEMMETSEVIWSETTV